MRMEAEREHISCRCSLYKSVRETNRSSIRGALELCGYREEGLAHVFSILFDQQKAGSRGTEPTRELWEAQLDPWAHCISIIRGYGAFDNKAKSFQLETAVVIHSSCFHFIFKGLLYTAPWLCLGESVPLLFVCYIFEMFVFLLNCCSLYRNLRSHSALQFLLYARDLI